MNIDAPLVCRYSVVVTGFSIPCRLDKMRISIYKTKETEPMKATMNGSSIGNLDI